VIGSGGCEVAGEAEAAYQRAVAAVCLRGLYHLHHIHTRLHLAKHLQRFGGER
jgi:hypothetical protein